MKGIFVLLSGYIDESVSKGQKMFTLSALVGVGDEWQVLSDDWQNMLAEEKCRLRQEGRRTLSRYHASECNALDNEFEGWNKQEQIAFTVKMLELIKQYPMKTIAYTVNLDALSNAIPDDADLLATAYSLCTNFLVYGIGKWLLAKHADPATRITLIHDRCDYDWVILQQFNNLLRDDSFSARDFFTTIAPMCWKDCVPLQPADLMAYENMKDAERRPKNGKIRRTLELILGVGDMGALTKIIGSEAMIPMGPLLKAVAISRNAASMQMPKSTAPEYDKFNKAMDAILRADPAKVKAEVNAEIQASTKQRLAKGQRKRGRRSKSPSDAHASGDMD
jgi:hypothetical protein